MSAIYISHLFYPSSTVLKTDAMYGAHEFAATTDSHMDLYLDRNGNEEGTKVDTGRPL